jgi:peptide-methionine (R)-S-oxide reductase
MNVHKWYTGCMKSDDELTPEEYDVLRNKGTEPPFTGKYVDHHEDGMYRCKVCGTLLFSSKDKFDSGTGWPSFTDVVEAGNIELRADTSHGMNRTEVLCKTCGAHLGHVFDDGPPKDVGDPPSSHGTQNLSRQGKRYCINSICLDFEKHE